MSGVRDLPTFLETAPGLKKTGTFPVEAVSLPETYPELNSSIGGIGSEPSPISEGLELSQTSPRLSSGC